MQKNEVNFKALTFVAEQISSTFNFEVKGVRALWDPGLSIPGTNRRGGWRCPVGTRYGGQITDRFGRSCGWGVARRIANQIADIGARLENVDDRRRNSRVAKRNARMQRFLARQEKPGLLERGARGVAEALDGGQTPRQVGQPARRVVPMQPRARPTIPTRAVPELPRRDENDPYAENLRTMSDEDLNKQYEEAKRDVDRLRDAVDKPRGDGKIGMLPVSVQRSTARQRLDKVNVELNRRGRKVPRRQGNLRESEARRMERELVEPGAPRTGEPARPQPNAPRRRRRAATQQGAKRTARRKPETDFVDGAQPEPTKVPRRKPPVVKPKPQLGGMLDSQGRVIPVGGENEATRLLREALERNQDGIIQPPPAQKPATPIPNPPTWNPTADAAQDLGGSLPDERSARNVRNRFRERGLPDTAYWREKDFPEGEEKAELERRFGRYYGGDNKRNARGDYVNREVVANQAGAEQPAAPPAARTSPPPVRRVFNVEGEFDKPEDADMLDLVRADLNGFEPNAFNNLRNQNKDALVEKQNKLNEAQKAIDERFEAAIASWNRDKDIGFQTRADARADMARAHIERERNRIEREAVSLRIIEVDAGIAFQPKERRPVAVGAPQVRVPQAPIADAPEPEGGFDVSPPSPKADHSPEKLGRLGEDGLPEIKTVPIGNKGINTKEDAIGHLERGGDLVDVPDDLLADALSGAAGRFEKKDAGGGVNAAQISDNMFLFKDRVTGKKYFLKYTNGAVAENEDIHELVGNNLAGRFGMPIGAVRTDGKQKGKGGAPHSAGRAIVFEHAGNYAEGELASPRDADVARIKASDRVRATLMDFVIVNRDRHQGNFFMATDANGNQRFVPIDPSLGFDVNWGGRDFQGFDGDDAGFNAWMRHNYGGGRNRMLGSLRYQFQNQQLTKREVIAAIADVQRSIREAERKNPYLNVVDNALKVAGDGTQLPRAGDDARERIGVRPMRKMRYITDVDPTRLADLILGL